MNEPLLLDSDQPVRMGHEACITMATMVCASALHSHSRQHAMSKGQEVNMAANKQSIPSALLTQEQSL